MKFFVILLTSSSIVFRFRIRNCLTQLYAKDITPDDKQELDEALQREVSSQLYLLVLCTINHDHLAFFIQSYKNYEVVSHRFQFFFIFHEAVR